MAVRDEVDRIIAKRKEKGEALKARMAVMHRLQKVIEESTESLADSTKEIKDQKLRKQYGQIFMNINSEDMLCNIDECVEKLEDGIKRFNRDYISIATIGKEGQGKSQLLQSVSSLDNNIIPAYNGTSCTGATSIIWNDGEMLPGTVRATITFRQPAELLDIIKPYINKLDPDYLKNNPLEFNKVKYIKINQLSLDIGNDADKAAALKHLTNIVKHFSEYKDLFGASPLTLTDPELIKRYVAQNNGKNINDPEAEFYYNYLAVARADIYCPFFTDTGKIRLVDTVGIGATQYGIEEAMLNTVDRECDAAIVVTKPDTRSVQTVDIDLYNSLRNRFVQRDINKWLFYLVNHHLGRNDDSVDAVKNEIIGDYKFSIADCQIIDASNQDEVRDNFIIPMLRTLLNNMDDIDRAYLEEIEQKEQNVYDQLRQFLDSLPTLDRINASGQLGMEAYEKGKQCFNRMTADLSRAVCKWSEEREKPNSVLWNGVQKILNNLDSIIPTPEKIDAISQYNGALLGEDIWQVVLHYVRNEITDRFIAIDDALEKETKAFKNSLVSTLYHELRQLSRSQTTEEKEDEDCDMVEWLKEMMDDILGTDKRYEQIRRGFNFLYQFEFNTRAQLIQEVRRQLYIINPICPEYAKPSYNFHHANCGNAIHFYLTSRMSVVEEELRYHLAKLDRTPNQAFYAAAEEFYDRLTFASDLSGNEVINMSDTWGFFFQEYSSRLWKEDAERFDEVNRLIQIYNEMIERLTVFLNKKEA